MASNDLSGHDINDLQINTHKNNFFISENINIFFSKINHQNFKELLIIHLNIRSLRKYWNEINIQLKDHIKTIDILIFTEIAIPENENVLYNIQGFKSTFLNRTKKKGGGIVIYMKEHLQGEIVQKEQNKISNHELIHAKLQLNGKKWNVLAIYRPPNTNKILFINEMQNVIKKIHGKENIILVGDINIDTNEICDLQVNRYEEIMASEGMENCIFANTREQIINGKLTVSRIDHIYVRVEGSKVDASVIKTYTTDHYTIAVNIEIESNSDGDFITENNQNNIRYKEKQVQTALSELKWEGETKMDDPIQIYNSVCNKFTKVYNKCRQIKCTPGKIRSNKCWITKELIDNIKIRDRAFKRWKSNPTKVEYKNIYTNLRNKLNKEIKSQKMKFQVEKIGSCQNNMKKMWKEINTIIGKKEVGNIDVTIRNFLGKKFNLGDIRTAFVNEFSTGIENMIHKCDILVSDNGKIEHNSINNVSIYIPKINEANVEKIISNMKPSKSPGIDLIRTQDLKYCKHLIAPMLANLINVSIKKGIIPNKLKTSILRPIYKGGVHTQYKNYRPIAILPAVEKIMESYVSSKLNKYLATYNVINENQHGFQRGKSTVSLLENFTDYINGKLNTNKLILALFIDLKKAFDTINHQILITRLDNIGIRGNILNWFKNYLNNRTITVMIDKTCSETKEINVGIPQGSILGPILYTIYVNPVFEHIKNSKMYMYADDTALIFAHNEQHIANDIIQDDFNTFQRWIHDNKLIINEKKTKLLCIRTPKKKVEALCVKCHSDNCLHNRTYINNNCACPVLEEVNHFKYLGIYIDNKFNWNKQVEDIANKLRACAAQFYKLQYILDFKNLLIVYNALVKSILQYAIQCYGSCSMTNTIKIERIHNIIVKRILSRNYKNEETNILPFNKLYKYKMIVEYYYQKELMRKVEHGYMTRNTNYCVPITYNKYGDRKIEAIIPKMFNSIPIELRGFTKISIVKKEIKMWLLKENN